MSNPLFLGHHSGKVIEKRPAILGCPLDLTSTYRGGSDEAPSAIRISSDSIETYCPYLDRDLKEFPFSDLGDIHFSGVSLEEKLNEIRSNVETILGQKGVPFCIGGEHTVTFPIIQAMKIYYDKFVVLHLDAHSDLRDSYEGQKINHSTVMRRVAELVGHENLIQLGIRSGTREEFQWIYKHHVTAEFRPGQEKTLLNRIGGRSVYLSLDLDVLDPSCFPGVGNPEAGGWSYERMGRFIRFLNNVNIIGLDVVELIPGIDKSELSSITAAKIIRSLLLIC
ncbi:MAG: agmatinase [Desulfomonilaceae bacterium]